ncbi:hypothetical protein M5D96_004326 [Drosophila gunungcola]|uniref:Uncharacterized protein n=1 Tax=Drosophila gunungcola TaxID=103775 RepID=A0A9P9YTW3_9MUSC|nr:hypothetical protein M5D96_004326 [Drosophila gunungcola]
MEVHKWNLIDTLSLSGFSTLFEEEMKAASGWQLFNPVRVSQRSGRLQFSVYFSRNSLARGELNVCLCFCLSVGCPTKTEIVCPPGGTKTTTSGEHGEPMDTEKTE